MEKKTLVIIPAYNEENNIKIVIDSLSEMYPEIDYIVINDCSNDRTKEVLQQMHANYIDLPLNLGIGGGVQTGYIYAYENQYDVAVQIDGDGQHDITYLKDVIAPILNDTADCVIGSRYINNEGFQSSFMRRVGINFLSRLIKICTGISVKDVTSGFRAVNRTWIQNFALDYAQDYPEPEAIITEACRGARILEVPVKMNARLSGESSISGMKTVYYMIKVSLAIILQRISLRKEIR